MTIEKKIDISVNTDQAEKDLDKFNNKIKETDKSTEGLTNTLDGMTGGAVGGFKKMLGGVKTLITGFKSLKVAIAATGIGLLIIAVGSLAAAFKSSEEGANKFTKILNQIKVVVGNVVDILSNLGNALLGAGKALVKLAKGDIKGATAAWNDMKESVKEVGSQIKNFVKETREELAKVRDISDQLAKADKLSRDLLVQRAEAERDIATLREKVARRDLYTAEERKNALIEAGRISDEIINKEIELARIRYEAIVENNKLSNSTKEDLDAEAQAQADLIQLEQQRYARRKELGAELSAINQQEEAERQARIDAEKKAQEDEAKRRKEIRKKEADADKKANDEKLQRDLELRQKQAADAAAQAQRDIELRRLTEQTKYDIANQTFNALQMLLGENSKIGKGIAVAQATMNTYQGVTAALTAPSVVPEPFATALRFANAAATGAFGISQVTKILSVDESGKSSQGSASSQQRTATGQAQASAPSFNLIQGTGTNQIANSVAKNLQPQKAYVVSSDVTTSQELDRKIVEGASL